jgi:phosphoribosylanthranilate isomerase
MLKIKVCGMADPENAGLISKMEVDYMGFIFYPGSKRYVGDNPDESLFNALPGRILKTGVFADADPSLLSDVADKYGLDLIQLHGNETTGYCRSLNGRNFKIIKAFKVGKDFNLNTTMDYLDVCDYFLFDTDKGNGGGSGTKFDWSIFDGYNQGKPFFLSGGIGPDDAETLRRLEYRDLFAVDINSRFEFRPGFKDAVKVERFIKIIKDDKL